MKKKKAIIIGTAVAIVVRYVSLILMLLTIGLFYKEEPCTEYADDGHLSMFIIFLLLSLITSASLALLVGQSFVRRYGRDTRWKITLGLIASVMIVLALLSGTPFDPLEYIFSCVQFIIPVVIAHFINHFIRCMMIRRKHHF